MHKRVVLLGVSVVVASSLCAAAALWNYDLGHAPVERLPLLHGEPLSKVLKELGEPTQQFEYAMRDSPGGEFRIELYNTYPPNDPVAMQARILEMQWHRHRYSIVVWMHQINGGWAVLDTCRWQENVRF